MNTRPLVLALVTSLGMVGCNVNNRDGPPTDSNGGGGGPGGTGYSYFNVTVDGQVYSNPSLVVSTYYQDQFTTQLTTIATLTGREGIGVVSNDAFALITYTVLAGTLSDISTYEWVGGDDHVTVTLDTLGPDLAEGTFSGTLYPDDNNPPDQQHVIVITNGSFSVEPNVNE